MSERQIPIAPYRLRPCSGCIHRVMTWGIAHCALGVWDNIKDEVACSRHPNAVVQIGPAA